MSLQPTVVPPSPSPGPHADSSTPGRPSARLHGLDALRGGALLLGILLHALMPFVPGMPWLVVDPQPSEAVLPAIVTIHLFRMVTFMLLAGFFGAMVLRRRGAGRYFTDRLKRILLPMVAFWPVAVLSLGVLAIANTAWRGAPPPAAPSGGEPDPMMIFTPGQLWFLWTLMQCIVIVLLVRLVLRRLLGAERTGRVIERIGTVLATPFGVLLAAVPYAVGLLLQGQVAGAIVAPMTLRPEASSLVPYLGAFIVGWALFTAPDALQRLARQCWPHLAVAAVATAGIWFIDNALLPLPVAAVLIAVAGWTWTYGLVGLCVRYLRRERPVVRYLADSSYWAYLLHLPLLVLGEMLVADQPWPVALKLIIVLGGTGVVLLVSYHLLVRSTFLGKWLNGRKYPFRLLPASRHGS